MEDLGVGAGLAALAFWGFVAVAVLASYWDVIRKRDAQHETLRRAIESGQSLDQQLVDKLLSTNSGGSKNLARDFQLTALWILPVAPGLAIFALILGAQVPDAQIPLLGASALVACLGVGFFVAAKIVHRWYPTEKDLNLIQQQD